jgi:hypothetical protein
MGVTHLNSTLEGGVTPICNECGIALCWDLAIEEYLEAKSFWDTWRCEGCNPDYALAWTRWKVEHERNLDK